MADQGFPTRLWTMADLYTPMALRVAATLRLADHIAAGVTSVDALAETVAADPQALRRLVAHLIAVNVLTRSVDAGLSLTELGTELREGHPAGGRAWLDIGGAVGRADLAALHLLESVRTGQPAYPLAYGRGYWEDLAADPQLSESFDRLMSSRLRDGVLQIVAGYSWDTVGHLVDVGGGDGTLLMAIASAHPGLRGTVVELAAAAAAARRGFEEAGLSERCTARAGSFFDELPPGADAYLLSGVIHDWDDEHALTILRRCADAARPGRARVLVMEDLNAGAGEPGVNTEMDLRMLTFTGGRERTQREIQELAERADLRLAAAHRLSAYRTLIELQASPASER